MTAPPVATPATQAAAAVRVEGLRHDYPDGTTALRGIDVAVDAGESLAIVGPNGAGKSTLLLHLNGVLEPTAGAVHVGDTAVARGTLAEVRTRVGLVFQDPDDQLFSPTVRDDVAYGPIHAGLPPDEVAERVARALEAVGAAALVDRAPHHLSVGQRKRVALATVLSMDPGVLVFDEPTAGLDPRGRDEVAGLVSERRETRIVSSHDMRFVSLTASRVVILDDGALVADGPTEEILADDPLLRRHGLEPPCG